MVLPTHILEIKVSIECEGQECEDLLSALKADDANNWITSVRENKVEVTVTTDKITSLYNLVDDLMRSYEVFKKLY